MKLPRLEYRLALVMTIFLSGYLVGNASKTEPTVANSNSETLTVERVKDGDSIVIRLGNGFVIDVRLKNIDAPELHQPFGQQAKNEVERLCYGKKVIVEGRDRDKYGRILGRVTCNGISLNTHLVGEGFAWVFDKYNSDQNLHQLEKNAEANCKGLWLNPDAIAPWVYRHSGLMNDPAVRKHPRGLCNQKLKTASSNSQ